jgi:hypothetical protein
VVTKEKSMLFDIVNMKAVLMSRGLLKVKEFTMTKKPNSWAVECRYIDGTEKETEVEWETVAWYPSVIIDTINNNKIHEPYDLGKLKAAHHAFVQSKNLRKMETQISYVYFGQHNQKQNWSYEGKQGQ